MDTEWVIDHASTEKFIAAFLTGSRSYGTALKGSDYDWRIVTTGAIARAELPGLISSATLPTDIKYADLDALLNAASSGTLYDLNLFFCGKLIAGGKYEAELRALLGLREEIAAMDLRALKRSLCAEIYRAAQGIAPNRAKAQCRKSLQRVVFYSDILRGYAHGKTFFDCLHPADTQRYIQIRETEISKQAAMEQALACMGENDAPEILNFYEQETNHDTYKAVVCIVDELLKKAGGAGAWAQK